MSTIIYMIPALGLIGLLVMAVKASWVKKQEAGEENMQRLAGYISDGAIAFLKAEWKKLSYFVVIASILLVISGNAVEHSSPVIAIAFIIGAVFSALAGYIGMKIATAANVRTAHAAKTSLSQALKVSFTGGTVMGLGVAGLAILGLGGLFIVFIQLFDVVSVNSSEMKTAIEVLTGFSLGAESIALFARVGGGIYTKAADVGADLVGKVEAGIPEDDVRNPATIADNVGDNVGDVAGMGADLFGSYVATILATMVLGQEINAADNFGGFSPILLPMIIAGLGLIASIIGTLFVRIKKETDSVQNALNLGNWMSILITAIVSYFLVMWMLPDTMSIRGFEFTKLRVFLAIGLGLVVGALMSIITEYYTAMNKRPVLSIVRQSATGHATNIIGGLSVGMESTVLPIIILAAGIFGSYELAGLYGVAIAAAGMMATTAMQLAIDAFGPIADNAGGIAEMSQLPAEVRERTDNLDAVGNTTAATGKGFAIASAALTSLALLAAYVGVAMPENQHIDIYKADVLAGLFIGAMIPFIFSALAIAAVGRAAMAMVEEVRRQFREIPGIMEYKAEPEYQKCVAISTEASIREMMLPGAIALITPIIVGFLFGPEVLAGLLAGVTVSGVLMGIFQSNAGGAWDNAKKSFEKGVVINGETFYKKSEPHKAAVTGDTVGDPFKDTSGPSMNILIKLMSIVSLVIAPFLHKVWQNKLVENNKPKTEITTAIKSNEKTEATPMSDMSVVKGNYSFDIAHSFVDFKLSHMLTTAKGSIALVNGTILLTDDLNNSSISFELDAKSVNTKNAMRDEHLQAEDYFDVVKYPTIKFVGKRIELNNSSSAGQYVAIGDLTIKNVTTEIGVPFNYVGSSINQMSKDTAHTFRGELTVNRIEYGVGEESSMIGSEVKIEFDIETYRFKNSKK